MRRSAPPPPLSTSVVAPWTAGVTVAATMFVDASPAVELGTTAVHVTERDGASPPPAAGLRQRSLASVTHTVVRGQPVLALTMKFVRVKLGLATLSIRLSPQAGVKVGRVAMGSGARGPPPHSGTCGTAEVTAMGAAAEDQLAALARATTSDAAALPSVARRRLRGKQPPCGGSVGSAVIGPIAAGAHDAPRGSGRLEVANSLHEPSGGPSRSTTPIPHRCPAADRDGHLLTLGSADGSNRSVSGVARFGAGESERRRGRGRPPESGGHPAAAC